MQINYKGTIIDVKKGTTIEELLNKEIERVDNIIACRFNNEVKSLDFKIEEDGNVELIDITDKDGMRIYMRGLLYILSMAFNELYPEALLTVNYQLYHSTLCEVDNMDITEEMIEKINKKMREITESNLPIVKKIMTKQEAEEFYKKENTLKGRLQLELETKKEVTLYYCKDFFNYFYGVMPTHTGCIKTYEVVKYHDGFLVRYPSRSNPNELRPLMQTKKLLATLDEYEDVHKILNINTLYKLNKKVKENQIKDYILLDEALHEKKIAAIADNISRKKDVKVILIAGPSSSGKTTFAKKLELQLRINGLKPKTISVDNYFVDREYSPKDENGEYDFECIEAIDRELLNNNINELLLGKEIKMPTFNFHTGHKEYKGNTMSLNNDELLIMEGIHCLNDELTYLIPKDKKYKIYISALTVLNIDYFNRISTTDTRLIRRIARDNQFRGYSALHTLKIWPSVNRGEKKNIFRFQEEADIMFNSSLIYELGVLKPFVQPLLEEIDNKMPEFSEAKRLRAMLGYFETISPEYVPNNSLIREFIGGSIFEE